MFSFISNVVGKSKNVAHPTTATTTTTSTQFDEEFHTNRPRLVMKEGMMTKEGEVFKTWHARYFKLAGLTLSYYTEKDQIKGVIPLQNAIVRTSHRKGMELGFELVINPSAASLQGALLLSSNGELQYAPNIATPTSPTPSTASTATNTEHTGTTQNGKEKDEHLPQTQAEERVYYLCLSNSDPLAHQHRTEWMDAIQNNITYEHRLRQWLHDREGRWELELTKLRREVERTRAEREMEQLQRATEEQEKRAAEAAEREARDAAEAERAAAQTTKAKACPASAHQAGLVEAVEQVELLMHQQVEADQALDSGSLSGAELVAALKRKNATLEADVRMILAENRVLKEHTTREAEKIAEEMIHMRVEHLRVDMEKREAAKLEATQREATNRENALIAQVEQLKSDLSKSQSQETNLNTKIDELNQSLKNAALAPLQTDGASPTPASGQQVDDILQAASTPHSAGNTLQIDLTPSTNNSTANSPAKVAAAVDSVASPSSTTLPPSSLTSPTTTSPTPISPPSPSPSQSSLAALAPQSHVGPVTNEKCKCECMPPCVSFFAHKSSLLQVSQLDARLASLAMERQQLELAAQRYKSEKKVLKQEVIRLRALLPQQ